MQSRTDLVVNQTARTPILTIPDVSEGSADFKQRLAILINAPTTHIYIDNLVLDVDDQDRQKFETRTRRLVSAILYGSCRPRARLYLRFRT